MSLDVVDDRTFKEVIYDGKYNNLSFCHLQPTGTTVNQVTDEVIETGLITIYHISKWVLYWKRYTWSCFLLWFQSSLLECHHNLFDMLMLYLWHFLFDIQVLLYLHIFHIFSFSPADSGLKHPPWEWRFSKKLLSHKRIDESFFISFERPSSLWRPFLNKPNQFQLHYLDCRAILVWK